MVLTAHRAHRATMEPLAPQVLRGRTVRPAHRASRVYLVQMAQRELMA